MINLQKILSLARQFGMVAIMFFVMTQCTEEEEEGISKNLFFVTSSLILLLEEKVKRSF